MELRANGYGASKEDVGNMYIDWAVNKGFAVLDVNIPQALTMEDVCGHHFLGLGTGDLLAKGDLAKKREYDMMKQTEEICVYLWDNYIEYASVTCLVWEGCAHHFVQDR